MHVRWESPSRYYEAVLQRDLLGDWVLSTANGGLRNRLGALRHLALPSRDAAVKELASLHKLRLRRGYRLVASRDLPTEAATPFEAAKGRRISVDGNEAAHRKAVLDALPQLSRIASPLGSKESPTASYGSRGEALS